MKNSVKKIIAVVSAVGALYAFFGIFFQVTPLIGPNRTTELIGNWEAFVDGRKRGITFAADGTFTDHSGAFLILGSGMDLSLLALQGETDVDVPEWINQLRTYSGKYWFRDRPQSAVLVMSYQVDIPLRDADSFSDPANDPRSVMVTYSFNISDENLFLVGGVGRYILSRT